MKTARVHHLFSDLEANVFHTYDFDPLVTDVREQYPLLPLEETIAIADQCGVPHPADPFTRQPIVMTTDFYLTVSKTSSFSYLARSIKYKKDLENLRVLEKLEIERRYWKERGIDWGFVRECDLDMTLVRNVKWVRPYFRLADLYPLSAEVVQRVAVSLTRRVLESDLPLWEVARTSDQDLCLIAGSNLAIARHLLASHLWIVDMHTRIEPCERLVLLTVNSSLSQIEGSSSDRDWNPTRVCA